jgi:circadian clock protein KaiB
VTAPSLILFVSGGSPTSRRARENLARLAAHDLPADWVVEIIDVMTDPARAEESRILATPTLSLGDPARPRRIVGDLSERARVLEFLGIETRSEAP